MKLTQRQLRKLLEKVGQEIINEQKAGKTGSVAASGNPAVTKAREQLRKCGNAFGALGDDHSAAIGDIILRLLETTADQTKDLDNIGRQLEKLNPED